MRAEQLREKYPLMKYEPDQGCKFCGGTGEREVKGTSFLAGPTCCICLFVGGGREDREEIARDLGETARRIRQSFERTPAEPEKEGRE